MCLSVSVCVNRAQLRDPLTQPGFRTLQLPRQHMFSCIQTYLIGRGESVRKKHRKRQMKIERAEENKNECVCERKKKIQEREPQKYKDIHFSLALDPYMKEGVWQRNGNSS